MFLASIPQTAHTSSSSSSSPDSSSPGSSSEEPMQHGLTRPVSSPAHSHSLPAPHAAPVLQKSQRFSSPKTSWKQTLEHMHNLRVSSSAARCRLLLLSASTGLSAAQQTALTNGIVGTRCSSRDV